MQINATEPDQEYFFNLFSDGIFCTICSWNLGSFLDFIQIFNYLFQIQSMIAVYL